jgi:two-component system response regulator FlrC
VLLLGETGVGKEVAAKTIHALSHRAAGPFVAVNCAAITDTLLESELFGHEKGAFTGATTQRRGRIELASGGSFFLDEIGDMKPELQAKLLRVIQERRFERVGGSRSIEADVRWIAATNRDLGQLRESGAFREDLYHRIATFPIRLPPLRERRGDIGPLSDTLLAGITHQVGRGRLSLDAEARRWLAEADWPGNIRELANVLERAAILAEGPTIQVQDLIPAAPMKPRSGLATGGTLEEIEQAAIQRALDEAGGNRRAAAEALGIGLRTLYEKLKRTREDDRHESQP